MKERQRRKAAFSAKITKFTASSEEKKDGEILRKAKMFSEMEGKEEREKEAKLRKEEFSPEKR